ncbi:DNA primase [Acetobacter sp. AN02]|uniref:DNA primase n=1 Tax=Acetobacter sp. AN02 TaxID=2894186 RepID=UPI0024341EF1|nr:DNA primase [Acetobacter sp. AN02]MDG6094345.1 DNA primase [Acetobacter sp. AN02]
MAIDSAFLDELRARVPLAPLIGRRVKLARSGRNWKGCCPFHGEKTPSFYVYDDHFHCFGCGVHGDAISFVMQMDGRSFPEAVGQLASEAGMDVPRPTQEDRAAVARKRGLEDVLEAAQQIFVRSLREPAGREALAYLRRRGLTDGTVSDFGLGWAPEGRGVLTEMLGREGISPEMMAEAGLMRVDEHGHPKGELFWARVTFPIRDRRGSIVSFGGRTMGDGQPKYLNGPETGLFSKRRLLFGLDRARAALRAPRTSRDEVPPDLIVAEGYMDVIALHQAGFRGAVAPLGTALTAEQLEMLWQSAAAPVLCLDGDAAGRRAAVRATETALPLISKERTLRLCLLPEGEDPDSLLRGSGGTPAMASLLSQARPLSDILFDLLAGGTPPDAGPEARAALRERLTAAAATIADRTLASEYRSTLLDRFYATFRRSGRSSGSAGWRSSDGGRPGVRPTEHREVVTDVQRSRQTVLMALILQEPSILSAVEDAWCQMELPDDLSELREAVLDFAADGLSGASQGLRPDDAARVLMEKLAEAGLDMQAGDVLRAALLRQAGVSGSDDDPLWSSAEARWWHFFGMLNRRVFLEEVEKETLLMVTNPPDAEAWQRLSPRLEAAERLRRADSGL